jgi:hypothetical protein
MAEEAVEREMKEDNGRTAENGGRTAAAEEEASMAGGGGENGVFLGEEQRRQKQKRPGVNARLQRLKQLRLRFKTKIMELLSFSNILPQKTLSNIKLPEVSPVSGCYC